MRFLIFLVTIDFTHFTQTLTFFLWHMHCCREREKKSTSIASYFRYGLTNQKYIPTSLPDLLYLFLIITQNKNGHGYLLFSGLKNHYSTWLAIFILQTVAFKSFSKREQNVFVKQFLHLAQSVLNLFSP